MLLKYFFLKRATKKEMRIILFNGKILLAWKAIVDIQIIFEPYGCASYFVGYICKSERGMSAQQAQKEFWNEKKWHKWNVYSNCVEVCAQKAVYLPV